MTPSERAAIDSRIRWLQWRTIGVGWTAWAIVGAGAIVTLLALGDLVGLIRGRHGDDAVAFHVPPGLRHADGLPVLSLLVAGLALVGGWGLSTGRLRRAHGVAALVLCLVAGMADFSLSAPLHQPLFGIPSRLERLVSAGEYAEADRLVQGQFPGEHRQREAYVRAQIALRAGDSQRLESLGRPLLADADGFAYAGSTDAAANHVYHETMNDLRIEVLAAIDRRLHGVPVSAAGIAVDAERIQRVTSGTLTAIRAGSGLALVIAGLLCAALWRRMRANVLRIIDLGD